MANNFLKSRAFTSGDGVTDITDDTADSGSLVNLSASKLNFILTTINDLTGDLYVSHNSDAFKTARELTLHHDFATDGGAIGTINLRGGELPDNAIVDNAWAEVTTTYTSATDAATIAYGIVSDDATGIQAAVAISGGGNIWDAGLQTTDVDPQTASLFTTKTTAQRKIIMTIAVEAVTAGASILHLGYKVSELDTNT